MWFKKEEVAIPKPIEIDPHKFWRTHAPNILEPVLADKHFNLFVSAINVFFRYDKTNYNNILYTSKDKNGVAVATTMVEAILWLYNKKRPVYKLGIDGRIQKTDLNSHSILKQLFGGTDEVQKEQKT